MRHYLESGDQRGAERVNGPALVVRTDVVLTPAAILQIDQKLAEACRLGFAEVTLVVEKGRLRWIRGPAASEAVRE